MPEFASILLAVVTLMLGALLSFAASHYWSRRDVSEKAAERLAVANDLLLARVAELERQNALIGQAVLPINAVFQAILIKELTHFHTPIMDALMVKIGPPNTLTPPEEAELIVALKQREEDMGDQISPSERDAARMLPMVMKRVRGEENKPPHDSSLKIVSIPLSEEKGSPE